MLGRVSIAKAGDDSCPGGHGQGGPCDTPDKQISPCDKEQGEQGFGQQLPAEKD
ncbi:MAG: hypothetical protein UZ16_OP3001003535 [Candidatus Hinthialibacteria bacterium OLB16]|nr:MAG: hypothetical protein UZ16_OP3001003535 [Candidatus Hinthialibacteria bacterium OLB16]